MVNKFETNFIAETKDEMPFSESSVRRFFGKWCKINDFIITKFISREKWEKMKGEEGILEKKYSGKQTLFIPKDLQLWEMIDIIKTVDNDTFADKPDASGQRTDQIISLGEIFKKAGIYLSSYLPEIEDGKEIAQNIAKEFCDYGISLEEHAGVDEKILQRTALAEEDKQKLDEWFLGRSAYQKRMDKLGENKTPDDIEKRRVELLRIYFKALAQESYEAEGKKPWEIKKGPMWHLQDETKKGIIKSIKTPKRVLDTVIFKRGIEKLVKEMEIGEAPRRKMINFFLKKIGFDISREQEKFYDVLEIPKLKQELVEVRQKGDKSEIAEKEREIAGKVQDGVRSFTYKGQEGSPNHPSEMVKTHLINCVGSAILGGALLDELGIKYLHADIPNHSSTFLITSDDKVYWQDFTPPPGVSNCSRHEITNDLIEEGSPRIKDVVEFQKHPQDSGLSLEIVEPLSKKRQFSVNLFKPEVGLQTHVLINLGNLLKNSGKNEEAAEAYKKAIDITPKLVDPYNGLGNVLNRLGKNKEAIEAYKQAITINPKLADPYNGLGNVLNNLGRYKEAIEAYAKFIELCGDQDQYLVKRAKKIISKLEKFKPFPFAG
ncbi:MAG: tetratricopeptide repeat protein [bacterium]